MENNGGTVNGMRLLSVKYFEKELNRSVSHNSVIISSLRANSNALARELLQIYTCGGGY